MYICIKEIINLFSAISIVTVTAWKTRVLSTSSWNVKCLLSTEYSKLPENSIAYLCGIRGSFETSILGTEPFNAEHESSNSFETSVVIASGNNVISNKSLIFSVYLITVTEDQDVKKGNFVKLHVRQFTMSEYKFPFFLRCYCSY